MQGCVHTFAIYYTVAVCLVGFFLHFIGKCFHNYSNSKEIFLSLYIHFNNTYWNGSLSL